MKDEFLKSFDLTYDERGFLHFSSVNLLEIANKFGTPLYVISEDVFIKNINDFRNALSKNFKEFSILYASKAFSVKEVYRILQSENIGADVVSMGEILTALSVGFDPKNLYFHGNSKTDEDIEFALRKGINIVVDNESEFESIIKIASILQTKANILLRIKPGIAAKTHTYIMTGHLESKFGLTFDEAFLLISKCLNHKDINLKGFHYHIGSQILDVNSFEESAEEVSSFLKEVKEKFGYTPKELNVGGGFGIVYTESDLSVSKSDFVSAIKRGLLKHLTNLEDIKILIEPGRSLIGDVGVIIYKVVRKKKVKDKEYLFVDGGMGDNIRVPLYGAKYTVINLKRLGREVKEYSIFGKYCESGDIVSLNVLLESVEEGDYLVMLSAGAYTYSMASNYNRFPRPGVVAISSGTYKLIVKRETYEQVIQNDI
ncbi:diaminopimelate decarboxylase [Caldisericum exile]|uniref:Diaminopimelate decarboxylase n=1 Tax=Caldisericum exile (strain DSM 21853 / NBRC 104410 / AZM16c01) TaxID=511051 RepID=A0A7U6GDI0_CALEA|nr:diaminopimelate decarboxylase [Caldisericum exile]BAL80417.1 diaminopimelate decarboxylase [Caldisericum exile AZM16c01]